MTKTIDGYAVLFRTTTLDENGHYRAEARVGTIEGALVCTGIAASKEEAWAARRHAYDNGHRLYNAITHEAL